MKNVPLLCGTVIPPRDAPSGSLDWRRCGGKWRIESRKKPGGPKPPWGVVGGAVKPGSMCGEIGWLKSPKEKRDFGLSGFFVGRRKGALVDISRSLISKELEDLHNSRPESMNPYGRIFPPFVVTAVCSGESRHPLYPEEMALLRGASPRRACEFAGGRICARQVLADLGIRGGPLLAGGAGAPEWPKGIVGSISHTTGRCVAAACRIRDAIGLGVDVEGSDVDNRDITPVLCTESERAWVDSIPRGRGATLLLSVKESFFKGYHPLTGFFLEFDDVEVTFIRVANRFMVRLVNDNAPSLLGEREFSGRYWVDDRFVYTGLVLMGRKADSVGTHPGAMPGRG